MNKWWKSFLCGLFALASAMTLGLTGQAEGAVSVSIPVTIALSGSAPGSPERYAVRLTAEDAANPMPAGSRDGVYTLKILGAGSKNFPDISYDRVGVYRYTISQAAGTGKQCAYDGRVYTLTVRVGNAPWGGLEASAVLCQEPDGKKTDRAFFENRYGEKNTPGPKTSSPKTGDSANTPLDLALAVGSLGVLAMLALTRTRKKQ